MVNLKIIFILLNYFWSKGIGSQLRLKFKLIKPIKVGFHSGGSRLGTGLTIPFPGKGLSIFSFSRAIFKEGHLKSLTPGLTLWIQPIFISFQGAFSIFQVFEKLGILNLIISLLPRGCLTTYYKPQVQLLMKPGLQDGISQQGI